MRKKRAALRIGKKYETELRRIGSIQVDGKHISIWIKPAVLRKMQRELNNVDALPRNFTVTSDV
jgi:hypothetical protein